MQPYYERSGIRLYHGDCREVVPSLGESFSAVCTDPPYGLNFMGRDWDHAVPGVAFWQVFRDAMLPGGHLLAFGGSRTYHRIAVAIEDAGFEIRDTLQWLYGQGFPKSLDVSKAIDRMRKDDVTHVTTFLRDRSAGVSRKAMVQALGFAGTEGTHGVASFVSDDPAKARVPKWDQWLQLKDLLGFGDEMDAEVWRLNGRKGKPGDNWDKREITGAVTEWTDRSNYAITSADGFRRDNPATDAAREWQGWGTALKPAYEPIILARKPLSGTVAANVLAHGTGALNVDACRVGSGDDRASGGATGKRVDASEGYSGAWADADSGRDRPTGGRWPANVLLDPDAAAQLDTMSGERKSGRLSPDNNVKDTTGWAGGSRADRVKNTFEASTGGASRFFPVLPIDDPDTRRFLYTPKASRAERNAGLDGLPKRSASDRYPTLSSLNIEHQQRLPAQNHHPTVKPLALMRWLLTLVTPPGGTVLDPFAGSGTTGVAAAALGIPCVLIEQEAEYLPIIAGRIDHALDARAGAELPLFAGVAD